MDFHFFVRKKEMESTNPASIAAATDAEAVSDSIHIHGSESPLITGEYAASLSETSGGFPVYVKNVIPGKAADSIKLMYFPKSRKWKIRKLCGSNILTLAKAFCYPPGSPESISECWVEKRFTSRGDKYMTAAGIRVETRRNRKFFNLQKTCS
jgi:hypothetical protein